jgi:hypothetical protein
MHTCILCHNPIPDDLVDSAKPVPGGLACSRCIAELMKLLPKAKTLRDIPTPVNEHYRVTFGLFVTIVDGREAAVSIALHDRLQPWYLDNRGMATIVPKVSGITHNQFVDWVRRS